MALNVISALAVLYMLANGIAGLNGKCLTMNMDRYTTESVEKMSRQIAVPYIVVALVSIVPFVLNVTNHFSYLAYFINIAILLILLIYHVNINKKILVKK